MTRLSELPADWIDFYWEREQRARIGILPRCWGISSDALTLYALGLREDEPNLGEYPYDPFDLDACESSYQMAPEAVRAAMLPVLAKYRTKVRERYPHIEWSQP